MVMYEGQKRPDLWNIAGWAALAICVVLTAASLVGMFLFIRPAFVLTVVLCAVSGLSWWLPNRALRAELEAARERLVAFNGSESREALAEAKPVLYDQDTERQCNNCGHRAVFAWQTDGFPFAACNMCVSLWFEDGLPDHVVRLEPNGRPVVPLPLDDEHDDQCESEFINPPGAYGPCGCSDRANGIPGPTLIPVDGLNAWGSAIHADDDTSSTGPRSVPGPRGRVSD